MEQGLFRTKGIRNIGLSGLGLAAIIIGVSLLPEEQRRFELSPSDTTRIRDFCRQLSLEMKRPHPEVREALGAVIVTTTGRMAELLRKGTLTIYPEHGAWLRFEEEAEESDPRFLAVFTLENSDSGRLILIERTGWIGRIEEGNSKFLPELVPWLPQGLVAKMPPPLLLP